VRGPAAIATSHLIGSRWVLPMVLGMTWMNPALAQPTDTRAAPAPTARAEQDPTPPPAPHSTIPGNLYEPPPTETESETPSTVPADLHTGTFLRFHLAVTRFYAKYSPHPSSSGLMLGVDFGGTLVRGLALHGLLHGFIGDSEGYGHAVGQYGAALTYYFLPQNYYLTMMLGASQGEYNKDKEDVEQSVITDVAPAYGAIFGIESVKKNSHWAAGPALRLWYSDFHEGAFYAWAVVFAGTYH